MTDNGKVTIARDEQENVIRVSKNNPEFGYIRLVQNRTAIGTGNWVKKQSRSTLIHGTVEDLQDMGLNDATSIPGQIIVRESFEPFQDKDGDRDLKIAGETGIVCVGVNTETGEVDAPIYRKSFYSMDMNENDTLIAHTNGQAIREANGTPAKTTVSAEKLAEMTNPSEEEDITSSRRKKAEKSEETIEDSIEEIKEEEVVVEDASFEL